MVKASIVTVRCFVWILVNFLPPELYLKDENSNLLYYRIFNDILTKEDNSISLSLYKRILENTVTWRLRKVLAQNFPSNSIRPTKFAPSSKIYSTSIWSTLISNISFYSLTHKVKWIELEMWTFLPNKEVNKFDICVGSCVFLNRTNGMVIVFNIP